MLKGSEGLEGDSDMNVEHSYIETEETGGSETGEETDSDQSYVES